MDFSGKDENFVISWLKKEGFKESVVDAFIENEIDGDAFLLLNECQLKQLVPTLGPQAKLIQKHRAIITLQEDLETNGSKKDESLSSQTDLPLDYTDNETNSDECCVLFPCLTEEEPVLTVRETNVSGMSISSPPSKKLKLESSNSPFVLENDKLTKSLPDPFPFPDNFTPEISLAIRNQMMPPRVLNKFITAVARAVFAFKMYPTSNELERVSIQAIERWVFLRASYGSPFGHILSGLKSRFKEFRRTPRNMKRVKVANKENCLTFDDDDGEDDVSYQRHIKVMVAEYKKSKPNESIVAQLMEVTFKRRRHEVVNKAPLLRDLLDTFPSFHHYSQLISELGRIISKPNILILARNAWTSWVPKIISFCKESCNSKDVRDLVMELNQKNNSPNTVYEYALPLLLLAIRDGKQRTDVEKAVVFVPESVDINGIVRQVSLPTPTVLIRNSTAVLVVERQIICSIPVNEAPLGLLAAFYVFNIEYPKGIRKALMALEIIVLDIVPPKVDPKVASLLSALTKVTIDQ